MKRFVDIGELDQRIQLYQIVYEEDELGQQVKKRIHMGDAWAKVSNLHCSEYYTAFAAKIEREVSFVIRYHPDMDETTEIEFRGNVYSISYIDNVKYGNRYMEIKAQTKK